MRRKPPTERQLRAMRGALCALLSGEVGEGDWPPGVTLRDMRGALVWVHRQTVTPVTPRDREPG